MAFARTRFSLSACVRRRAHPSTDAKSPRENRTFNYDTTPFEIQTTIAPYARTTCCRTEIRRFIFSPVGVNFPSRNKGRVNSNNDVLTNFGQNPVHGENYHRSVLTTVRFLLRVSVIEVTILHFCTRYLLLDGWSVIHAFDRHLFFRLLFALIFFLVQNSRACIRRASRNVYFYYYNNRSHANSCVSGEKGSPSYMYLRTGRTLSKY